MINYLGSNLIYNEIEYFIYVNLWLCGIFILLFIYFILLNSCLLFINTVYFNCYYLELFITLLSIILLLFIISPSLIILLDYNMIYIPSSIIYTIGYQWAWDFNIYFWNTFTSYVDEYLIPISLVANNNITRQLLNHSTLIIPLYSLCYMLLLSYDVIHAIGYYSLGIKIDAIPSKINNTQSLRPVFKGEYRGYCFELCGEGHSTMIVTSISL